MYPGFSDTDSDTRFSLSQFLQQVQGVLEYHFPDRYWIIAEVSQVQRNRHCYITLTESDGQNTVAQVRATIWSYQLAILDNFEEESGQTLKPGMKVLLRAKVSFHASYGLSLQITDLDAGFTLGELALRKKKILDRLQREGLMDLNKLVALRVPAQRIAVISSATAAGYEDFINQLQHNQYGHQTYVKLFPALMQGAGAEASVTLSLRRIAAMHQHFDVIVIIRGGGSSLDLDCFNSYKIAKAIAQSPLPVLAGIGHQRDETIIDLVSFNTLKTPTAVAEFLLLQLTQTEVELEDLGHQISVMAQDWLQDRQKQLNELQTRFERTSQLRLQASGEKLNRLRTAFQSVSFAATARQREQLLTRQLHVSFAANSHLSKSQNHVTAITTTVATFKDCLVSPKMLQLEQIEKLVQAYDPKILLSRGYSITFSNGVVVKDRAQLEAGALLYTELANGGIVSQVVTNNRQKTGKKTKTKAKPNGSQLTIDL